MASLGISITLGLLVGRTYGVNNGLARTPQMGWVSSKMPRNPSAVSLHLVVVLTRPRITGIL